MGGTDTPGRPDLSGLKIDERARPSQTGARKRRIIALSAAVVIVGVGVALALRSRAAAVTVAEARPAGDPAAVALLNASGYITPRRRATVAAKITARVVDVYVDEGMTVVEGQLGLEGLPLGFLQIEVDAGDDLAGALAHPEIARRELARVSPVRVQGAVLGIGRNLGELVHDLLQVLLPDSLDKLEELPNLGSTTVSSSPASMLAK